MANIMDLVKTRIKTSRNGFDLSKKNAFTAKIGELLPVYCKEVMPGDKFNINLQAFTRTMPVSTAAYTRIREYYDFYFVPTNLLWNRYHSFITSMTKNNQQADGIVTNTELGDQHPYFTVYQITNYLAKIHEQNNMFGFNRADLTRKLLDYLNYGDYFAVDDQFPSRVNAALNPFPLLAYQKIYNDFFRNSQWEDSYAPAFNVNYIKGNGDLNIPISLLGEDGEHENMFDLKYCNWNKDYFMGLLPNSQFGDAASIDVSSINADVSAWLIENNVTQQKRQLTGISSGVTGQYGYLSTSPNTSTLLGVQGVDSSGVPQGQSGDLNLRFSEQAIQNLRTALGIGSSGSASSAFTILALRMQEAKQRWAEVVQSNNQDVQSQMNAQFGVSVSNAYSERCKYLGGSVSTLDINEVVNQNLTGDNMADIQGKGVGVHQGRIEFQSDVPGYVMCIYHAVPLLDYAITGIARQNLKTMKMDYAQPAFDKTGMVSVPLIELSNTKVANVGYDENPLLGYAPRYIDMKTDIDEVHGGFKNGDLDAWVAPVSDDYISAYLQSLGSNASINPLTYVFFKVNPAFLNPIFMQDVTSKLETDQLLINAAFDVKAVRNLDVNGLPY